MTDSDASTGARGETPLATRVERVLAELGGHPSAALALDLETADGRARWLCAARLASERDPEARRRDAFLRLDAAIGASPSALAGAAPERVAAALGAGGLRRPEPVAAVLCRAARALAERHDGDLERLAAGCGDLEELGSQLVALAPGLGPATVLRFLRPLRLVWGAARETPLSEAARAAAVHLGLLDAGSDLEGEPATLRRTLAEHTPGLRFADVEAALERLGALACRAERPDRCPLGGDCTARDTGLIR